MNEMLVKTLTVRIKFTPSKITRIVKQTQDDNGKLSIHLRGLKNVRIAVSSSTVSGHASMAPLA